MKKIEAIIRKTKFEDVKEALLAAELTVNFVEVEAESTSQERVHLLDILSEFIDVASLARVVSCTLCLCLGRHFSPSQL